MDGCRRLGSSPYETQMSRERSSWDDVWMDVAHAIAKRSYDDRFQVGCVVVTVDNTAALAVGYNGNFKGGPHEPESTDPGKSGFIHAENNCLIKCPHHYPVDKKMYVTLSPCKQCAKLIVNGGIKHVIYDEEYRDTSGLHILRDSGITVHKLSDLKQVSG